MTKTPKITLLLAALLALPACGGSAPWIPLQAAAAPEPDLTLVWVGRGECERFEDGAWVRRPEFDYDFSVEQRRSGDRWQSVKSMRRHHPDYDGSAGDRTQTWFFRLDLGAASAGGQVPVTLTSSLGDGEGSADRDFRHARLGFSAAGVSSLAPFDRYEITQHYDYEAGRLTETVELAKGKTAWVRNREVATLFAAHRFDGAPTTR